MVITEKQLFILVHLLKETLTGIQITDQFSITLEQRREMYAAILNQQSDNLYVSRKGGYLPMQS